MLRGKSPGLGGQCAGATPQLLYQVADLRQEKKLCGPQTSHQQSGQVG